ncbi:transposase [Nocardia sp. NPDC059239]|uniref:transposase n=1 Tax=Nocardia sp. NPDC059239 TaxID=3346785 RepID=UPI0036832C24
MTTTMATVEETYLPLPREPGTEVLLTCGNGFPLAVALSGANVNDHLLLPTLLDRVQSLCGRAGRPRLQITNPIADKGYDYPSVHSELRQRHITAYIPRRGTRDRVTAGRWVVEQSLCAAKRRVVSTAQPGGTWREVPGSNG